MSLTKEVILAAIADEMQRAIDNAEHPKGGQHAGPLKGDFWPVGVGVVRRFEWWLREIRSAREAQKLDGETYRSLYLSTQYGEAIFAGALFEHIERVTHDLVQRELQIEALVEKGHAENAQIEARMRALEEQNAKLVKLREAAQAFRDKIEREEGEWPAVAEYRERLDAALLALTESSESKSEGE